MQVKAWAWNQFCPRSRLQSVTYQICDGVTSLKLVICPWGTTVWTFLVSRTLHLPLHLQAQLWARSILRVQHLVSRFWAYSNLQVIRYWSCCIFPCDLGLVKCSGPFPRGCSPVLLLPSGILTDWLRNVRHGEQKGGQNIAPALNQIRF